MCKLVLFIYPELPIWNYDGSSTGQSDGHNSDTFLYPRAIYKDPFRRGNNILVMCDTYMYNMEPTGGYLLNLLTHKHKTIPSITVI